MELRKFVSPEFVFGQDARLLAGRYAHNFAAGRVLVVSDPGVAAAGWTAEVLGENRAVKLNGKSEVVDDFEPYAVHLYRITGAGGQGDRGP